MEQETDCKLQHIAKSSKESTVCLKTKFIGLEVQTGSGFFVEQNKIATNIHVVEGLPGFNVKVITAEQLEIEKVPITYSISKTITNIFLQFFTSIVKRLKANRYRRFSHLQSSKKTTEYTIKGVAAFDDKNDLVVLKTAEIGVPLSLGNSDDLENGDPVYIIGYDGTQYKVLEGNIVSRYDCAKQLIIKVEKPTKDIDGHSGGPVLNSKSEVIGIVESGVGSGLYKSGTGGVCFINAIPLHLLKTLMTNWEQVKPLKEWRKHPQIRAYTKVDLGNRKLAAGKYKQAIAFYDAALQRNPDLAHVYLKRGDVKDELGDVTGAIDDYDNAIRLNPEDATAYYNRGIVKDKLGDIKGAIEDYDNAIRLNPEHVSAYNNRGSAKDDLGDFASAILDYDNAIQLNAEDADFYNNRGVAKSKLDDFSGAVEDYNNAIRLNSNDADFFINRGEARKALGQHEEAEGDFVKVKELDPDIEK